VGLPGSRPISVGGDDSIGEIDGAKVGLRLGLNVGESVGLTVGETEGLVIGLSVGSSVGEMVGLKVGFLFGGCDCGARVGEMEGDSDGLSVGEMLGIIHLIGDPVGRGLGFEEGFPVTIGAWDGLTVGEMLGLNVGLKVGSGGEVVGLSDSEVGLIHLIGDPVGGGLGFDEGFLVTIGAWDRLTVGEILGLNVGLKVGSRGEVVRLSDGERVGSSLVDGEFGAHVGG